MPANPVSAGRIQLGVIGRAHGVRGLVKITSHTADPADLTAYGPLSDAEGRGYALRWKAEGVAEVSRIIDGMAVKVTERSQAEKLTNTKLFIDRSALPAADEDEYYLTDLIGMAAVNPAGGAIGAVSIVHDYGAGASLEIERPGAAPLLIPFTAACVPTVDIAHGRLVVVLPDEIVVAPDAAVPEEAAVFAQSQPRSPQAPSSQSQQAPSSRSPQAPSSRSPQAPSSRSPQAPSSQSLSSQPPFPQAKDAAA